MQQWRAEVDALARARHPHVVLLLGCCPEHGCVVYEYLPGGSLLEALQVRAWATVCMTVERRFWKDQHQQRLTWTQRIKIGLDVACGLLALHAQRPTPILHRDVKPANVCEKAVSSWLRQHVPSAQVLLDAHCNAKLGDAGLARLAPELHRAAPSPPVEQPTGTLAYMDPAYWRTGRCTATSDVYSLGVTLVQLLTGAPDPTGGLQGARAAVAARRGASVLAGVGGGVLVEVRIAFMDGKYQTPHVGWGGAA